MRIRCPFCKHPLTVPDEYYDRPVRCSICKRKFNPSGGGERGGSRPGSGLHRIPHTKPLTPSMVKKPSVTRTVILPPPRGRSPVAIRRRRNRALLMTLSQRRKERASLESEIGRATRIQFNLLPEQIPRLRGFDMRVHYQSAKEVSGDYYDFIPIEKRIWV